MLALLRGHSVDTYRLSPKIAADPLISRRIVESAWPIRPNRAANWYLAFAAEALPSNCRSFDRREDIVLAGWLNEAICRIWRPARRWSLQYFRIAH